jgi:hypothetical protein
VHDPDDKANFSVILNVTWANYGRNALDKPAKLYFFQKLLHLPMVDVEKAFDYWIMHNQQLPTIKDIIELCKLQPQFNIALPKPKNDEISQAGVEKINKLVAETMKPKVDHKAWARKILEAPEKCADIAVKMAREAVRAV